MWNRIARALDRHWFAPASLCELAVVRIVLVGVQLLIFRPSLANQLWLAGLSPRLYAPLPMLQLLLLPFGGWGVRPPAMVLQAVWLVLVISGVGALVGLATRLSLLLFAASNTFLIAHGYSYGEVHHPEAVLVIALWVLCVAPVTSTWTLDELWFRRRVARAGGLRGAPAALAASPFARWPLRTIQWVLVLCYFSAGCEKLKHGGLDWFNGYTLEFYVVKDSLLHSAPYGLHFASLPTVVLAAISVSAVLFELTFVLPVLWPRFVWPFVLAGILLHTAIDLTQRAPFYQYICLYVVFIEALRETASLGFAAPLVRALGWRPSRRWA